MGRIRNADSILLKNVHLDTVNSNRTISLVTLDESETGPTLLQNVSVARDAKIKVKGGNTFAHVKLGMRVDLELRMRDNQLLVIKIQQVRPSH